MAITDHLPATMAFLAVESPQPEGTLGNTATAALPAGFSYRMTAGNAGPSTARDVVVTDQLPAGLQLSSIIDSTGWSCAGPSCTLATLDAGQSASFTLVATITARSGEIVNAALPSSRTPAAADAPRQGLVSSAPVEVASIPRTNLPRTGDDVRPVLAWVEALLGGGALCLLVVRRRRRRA